MKRSNLALKVSAQHLLTADVVFSSESIIHPSLSAGGERVAYVFRQRTRQALKGSLCSEITVPRIKILKREESEMDQPTLAWAPLHPAPANIKINVFLSEAFSSALLLDVAQGG